MSDWVGEFNVVSILVWLGVAVSVWAGWYEPSRLIVGMLALIASLSALVRLGRSLPDQTGNIE